ncbi:MULTISPECIES: hypothetical protein [unclassified Bradyrhizobium]|uniref:hypothetical protein n=1 Tax=unclassified Bradyrhizobium TaxID=2631580 RepID=UPI001BABA4CE|nr:MULTISPECIES: hypothetical protein [unclassified Bradyrhizobium]MBR1206784.1 hypothetical protein [Bradyrhizobium sp. AUGA SZCCT0124]MBR1316778.1 hypothetical protein [Bradyrhizobium sp. AUGA SZCCT0051]MBR1344850.1 hypothetical protein [Bradyrhizobium sp. AUGA SZCCT0105]MBR1356354.1 hypothetical protein [Bradyrhizobium sp. AUGA SZCCT0045]
MILTDGRTEAIRTAARGLVHAAGLLVAEPMKATEESAEIFELYRRAAETGAAIRDAASLDVLLRLERDHLRPVAQSLRQYARRCHLQIVRCPWPPLQSDPNACAIVAGEGYTELELVAKEAGLRPNKPVAGQPAEQDLWRQVATAEILLIDLRESERDTVWPRACYAMGFALAISRVIFVITDCALELPFDVCVAPFDRSVEASLHSAASSLTAAMLQIPNDPRDQDLVGAAACYTLDVDPPADGWTRHTAQRLKERCSKFEVDPIAIRRAIDSHVGRPGGAYRTEISSFRPAYPDHDRRHCFHVLQFNRPDWVTQGVREACEPHVIYERGDTERDLQILDRIWNGIGRASLIVVDLTGVTSNVCLEFGVARILGRPLLLCHDRATWERTRLFPEIAQLSVELYSDKSELSEVVRSKLRSIRIV